MTQDELDALPEDGGIGVVEEVESGRTIRRPMCLPSHALYQGPNDVMLIDDRHGVYWTTGWLNGVLHKRRMRP